MIVIIHRQQNAAPLMHKGLIFIHMLLSLQDLFLASKASKGCFYSQNRKSGGADVPPHQELYFRA